jgi:hypothetical protein
MQASITLNLAHSQISRPLSLAFISADSNVPSGPEKARSKAGMEQPKIQAMII